MNHIVNGLQCCVICIDAAAIYSDTWKDHLVHMHAFLKRFTSTEMTRRLTKSDFSHTYMYMYITYLRNVEGQFRPRHAKGQLYA